MKKIFSLFAAVLFAGGMMAGDATVYKTMPEIVTENSYTISQGTNVTLYTSFALDANITVSTSGSANCGAFYNAVPNTEWRLYQAKSGDVTITAGTGCTLKKVTITYGISNTGALFDGDTQIASGAEQTVSGSSVTYTVKNTSTATNGQVKITAIKVVYEDTSIAVSTPTFSPESGDFFGDALEVTLACTTPDADIYYTVNGVDPKCDCSDAPEYKKPFTITETTTIKAAAYTGNDWSAVAVKTYTKHPAFASIEDLVASDLASNDLMKVSFENVKITGIASIAAGKRGVFVNVKDKDGEKDVEIFYNGAALPDDWAVGGEISGSIIATWTLFGSQWEIVPSAGFDWAQITYKAPSSEGIEETIAEGKTVKVVRNGQVLIMKGDKTLNVIGQIVR